MSTRWYAADWLLFEGELRQGWALEVSEDGNVASARAGVPPASATHFPNCVLLPGLVNAHSHAFQRLLRGRTEFLQSGHRSDDFWSWRELMYQAAAVLDPEQLYVASRHAFLEMALAGITSVGEFHYLHLDPTGVAYERGAYRTPANPAQRRFVDPSPGAFLSALDALRNDLRGELAVSIGAAPHSI